MSKQFEDVSCIYGAPMGRRDYVDNPKAKVRLFRVRMVDHCYDDGGAYWGAPSWPSVPHLYCARDELGQVQTFLRSWTREEAKEALLKKHPALRFHH